jgi:hypothetical protein
MNKGFYFRDLKQKSKMTSHVLVMHKGLVVILQVLYARESLVKYTQVEREYNYARKS